MTPEWLLIFAVVLVSLTSFGLLISRNWRFNVITLAVQYIGVLILVSSVLADRAGSHQDDCRLDGGGSVGSGDHQHPGNTAQRNCQPAQPNEFSACSQPAWWPWFCSQWCPFRQIGSCRSIQPAVGAVLSSWVWACCTWV